MAEVVDPDVAEVVPPSEVDTFLQILSQKEQQPSTSWESDMDMVMGVEGQGKSKGGGGKKREPIVVHRILTSEGILEMKRKEQEEKKRKEEEKKERKRKREEKKEETAKKGKKGEGSKGGKGKGKKVLKATRGLCCQCLTDGEGNWVQCDTCERWVHMHCVPSSHQGVMLASIKENKSFCCHICTYFD